MLSKRLTLLCSLLLLCSLAITACGGGSSGPSGSSNGSSAASGGCTGKVSGGPYTLTAWFHAGIGAERDVWKDQVTRFNNSQNLVKVNAITLPGGNYNDQIKAAAASGTLPDILDFDGPNLYNYAWNKNLKPLDSCISSDLKADLLPSIINQGTYNGKMYGIGSLDSGLALFSRKSILQKNGIRIPTGPKDAWTAAEFTRALKTLQASGIKKPLDLKNNYGRGEWYTYGFSPIVQSAGADLIDRTNFQSADGVLNGAAAVQALSVYQSWYKDGLVDRNEDDAAFKTGRSVISWVGFWEFNNYKSVYGDDLVLLPLPDFGKGSKTGMGSWQWGITSNTKNIDAAWSFINFMLQSDNMLQLTKSDGAIPSRKSVIEQSPQFATGGAERLYVDQLLGDTAVPRPQTPAYPTITTAFAQALQDIQDGKDVKASLDTAVQTIDKDIKDNQGYPTT